MERFYTFYRNLPKRDLHAHYTYKFWKLVKLISDFRVEHQKYHFLGTQKFDFTYPKDGTSGAEHENPRPVLESVTKTDYKTCFGFQF